MGKFGAPCWTQVKLTPEEQQEYYRKNLIKWKKGQSGNPKGRPKGTDVAHKLAVFGSLPASQKMKDALLEHYPDLPSVIELTLDDVIWLNLMIKATGSNINVIDFITERIDKANTHAGVATNPINLTNGMDEAKKDIIRQTIRQLRASGNE